MATVSNWDFWFMKIVSKMCKRAQRIERMTIWFKKEKKIYF